MQNKTIQTTSAQLSEVLRGVLKSTPIYQASKLTVLKKKYFLTPLEVQELYGLNMGTLRNLRNQGRGPAYHQEHKGAAVKYDHESIQNYLAKMKKVTIDAR